MKVRFSSFKHAPAETRSILRDRLRRFLGMPKNLSPGSDKEPIDDEVMLRLLLALAIEDQGELNRARASYEAQRAQSEPSFEQLVRDGWLRLSWGHVAASRDFFLALRGERGKALPALSALLGRRHEERFAFEGEAESDATLNEYVGPIARGELHPAHIPCLTPSWVAARLWDRRARLADVSSELREWRDKWEILGLPELVIFRAWRAGDASEFRVAALSVLDRDAQLTPWDDIRGVFVRRLALAQDRQESDYDNYVDPLPPTLVERAAWLRDHRLERNAYELLEESAQGIIRLLWIEVAAYENGPGPHPQCVELLDRARAFPEIFANLQWRVLEYPQLLADMALYGPTSALACLWVAQWRGRHRAWDVALIGADTRQSRETAFADVVWLLGDLLGKDQAPPAEVVALLEWFHSSAQLGDEDEDTPLTGLYLELRNMLSEQSRETLVRLLRVAEAKAATLDDAHLATLLDLIALGNFEADVNPEFVVGTYTKFLAEKQLGLNVHRIGAAAAAALYQVAARDAAQATVFLDAVDLAGGLKAAQADPARQFLIVDGIARVMRVHIRILARAITGSTKPLPAPLVTALIDWVRKGARDDPGTGQVAVFTPRFERGPTFVSKERPLAKDLASALHLFSSSDQDRFVAAILETDEPIILAQLIKLVPQRLREGLRAGLNALTPDKAAGIWQLTDAQARIEAILGAGVPDLAERYIADEAALKPRGNPPGREHAQFRSKLRLHYEKGEWDAILNASVPAFQSQMDTAPAREELQSFKALAVLLRPKGDPAAATQMFRELYRQHPMAGYANNLFAAGIADLLRDQPFRRLEGADARKGRELLAEHETMAGERQPNDVSDGGGDGFNKALLLLALDDADSAFAILSAIPAQDQNDRVVAYGAVALQRLGRPVEALAAIADAEKSFGTTELLALAKTYLSEGQARAPTALLTMGDESLVPMKAFMGEFQNLDAATQARILVPGENSLERMIINDVRSVSAELTGMVASYSRVQQPMYEDDATAVFVRLLRQRVIRPMKWTVDEQSPGGFSKTGGVGTRDITVKHDTLTLAVIENVVCRKPIDWQSSKDDLEKHFQKLLGYSTCRIFLHLTFAYVGEIAKILAHLEDVLQQPPQGFAYEKHEPIPDHDSGPLGFVARYKCDGRILTVCFLVLDMGQEIQKTAANAS